MSRLYSLRRSSRPGPRAAGGRIVGARLGGHPCRAPVLRQKVNYHLRALKSPSRTPYQRTRVRRHHKAPSGSNRVILCGVARCNGPHGVHPWASGATVCGRIIGSRWRPVSSTKSANSPPARYKQTRRRALDRTEMRFRSAAARAQFGSELTAALTRLVARYHDAPGGRTPAPRRSGGTCQPTRSLLR
jgi:hypothetical protein